MASSACPPSSSTGGAAPSASGMGGGGGSAGCGSAGAAWTGSDAAGSGVSCFARSGQSTPISGRSSNLDGVGAATGPRSCAEAGTAALMQASDTSNGTIAPSPSGNGQCGYGPRTHRCCLGDGRVRAKRFSAFHGGFPTAGRATGSAQRVLRTSFPGGRADPAPGR